MAHFIVECPVCEFDYTKAVGVEQYVRDVEDGTTYILTPGTSERVPAIYNPSRRRGAVVIRFDGECGHSFEMHFIQHKGQTLVEALPIKRGR